MTINTVLLILILVYTIIFTCRMIDEIKHWYTIAQDFMDFCVCSFITILCHGGIIAIMFILYHYIP